MIYIPIWLDLLFKVALKVNDYYKIYIPIWLDLLLLSIETSVSFSIYLHSNMVRFIMMEKIIICLLNQIFTFQYG